MMPSRNRFHRASLGLTVLLVTTFTLAFAATLHAQVLSDPRVAEFDPSPDHWVVLDSGEPAVLRYELGVYPLGASAPVGTVDMGKPAPDADGKIRYDFSAQVTALSLPGGDYEARVSAIGPQGAALSDPSNPFTFTTPSTCKFSLNATTVSASAVAGTYAVNVSTGTGCEWAVTNALPWVTVWTGGGSGSGTVPFAVQANSSSSSRTGTVNIAGQTLTVRQDGTTTPGPTFGKTSPANGASGLGSSVTLQWSAVADSGYWVCWDTTNNNTCDASWWPNGGGAGRVLTGLPNGTYYWQVRAQNASGTFDADGGTWWSFTVSATPTLFGKLTPANGAVGLGSTVTLQWSAVADAGYLVCWDTTNNNTCDGAWWPNGGGNGRVLAGLPPGTYYWQARAQRSSGTVDADNGTWWSFTVGGPPQPPAAFGKVAPTNGATGLGSAATLSWGSSTGATVYEVCVDATNDGACGATWQSAGTAASLGLGGLAAGTYYWQVRATNASGTAYADGGTWWPFTVGGAPQLPAAFGKVSPTNGATGLGSGVTLAWGTSTGATGYEVCADTTNDGACGATWQSAGTAASFGLSGLAAGTYYWQVRATNASGTAYADGGTWRSFTVSATPALFGKLTPANGAVGLGSTVTLQWSALTDAGYWVCWDTTNNNTCDGAWWPNGGGAGRVLTGLPNGTYYWQVWAQNATGTFNADGGTWRSFTVGGPPQPPAAFGKVMPANGATGLGGAVTLAWGTSTGATGYEVCVDTTNDGACGAAWQSAGTTAAFGLSGLAAGTYYWQVRATNSSGTAYADGGTWRSFTVSATPALFGKLTPANGAVGLGSTVMLQWSAVADAGYWVCWDTTNNNTCDSAWWPNGGGAGRVLTGLAPGTYYWQIRAQRLSGIVDADNGTWWTFTVR